LQQYEGTSELQLLEISNIMSGEQPTTEKPISPAEQTIPSTEQTIQPSEQPIVVSPTPSEEYPQQPIQPAPTIVLKGCNFTGCSIAFSGNAMNNVKSTSAEDALL